MTRFSRGPHRCFTRDALAVCLVLLSLTAPAAARQPPPSWQESDFDGQAAFEYLKEICEIGPRVSASRGMKKQQEYIQNHFEKLELEVTLQPFRAKSPYDGRAATLHNMIVRVAPEKKRRLLLCCHYDTRPFADQDRRNPRARFLGANDGASGVALLCELGKHLKKLDGPYGIDLVFFDGEEFVISRPQHPMFLGSTYFAQVYARESGKQDWKYEYGILIDMVADKDLQIHYEGNSLGFADGLTRSIWGVADRLGVKEFQPQKRHHIRDDHLPLNEIGKIPTCDVIDFDYPNPQLGNIYWHTQDDNVENCSAESLAKVGAVILEWTRQMQELNQGP